VLIFGIKPRRFEGWQQLLKKLHMEALSVLIDSLEPLLSSFQAAVKDLITVKCRRRSPRSVEQSDCLRGTELYVCFMIQERH
jgi:hypothetical protein